MTASVLQAASSQIEPVLGAVLVTRTFIARAVLVDHSLHTYAQGA